LGRQIVWIAFIGLAVSTALVGALNPSGIHDTGIDVGEDLIDSERIVVDERMRLLPEG
jgi:hypothetical protein